MASDAEEYEALHVHRVYEEIASHFSSTRYKPWPIVERFLVDLPDGSVGVDIGCGNGKYLAVNPRVFIVASDRAANLARIAAGHPCSAAVVADGLALPHPRARFDFAISIAVVHHWSTRARRVDAIRGILALLRAPGHRGRGVRARALIFVWALEQKESRRGWDAGDDQDVMVPWVRKASDGPAGAEREETFQRYYHLYRRGELEMDIREAGGMVLDSGYERDNWWAVASRPPTTS